MTTTPPPDRTCRACGAPLHRTFVDFGRTPLANSYVEPGTPPEEERWYPLHARVCGSCLLVQLDEVVPAHEIFSDYAYFSSYSSSWLDHARRFAEEAATRWSLTGESLVVEVASNDGYLLQYFADSGVRVIGIEPAANVAEVATSRGIDTEVCFLGSATGSALAARAGSADLVVANNVLAHVPDINDFVEGLSALLDQQGVLSIEFPHLLNLIELVQFDTIYHEHFSYLSLYTVERLLAAHGLRVFDVEQLPTHGGSLRVLACHEAAGRPTAAGRERVRSLEHRAGLDRVEAYEGFAARVQEARRSLRAFLDDAQRSGRRVVAYGAAAKGNTLLNSCGVTAKDIRFVVDRSPHKQGKLLPGSRLEVRSPDAVSAERPDLLLILPWNIADEVVEQMKHIREWGGRFVVPVPQVRILE